MIIIGVDFHPELQQIDSVDTDTGEFQEQWLAHREEAEKQQSSMLRFLLVEAAQDHSAQRARVAQQVPSLDDATRTENGQGRNGSPAGRSALLDDASGSKFLCAGILNSPRVSQ